MKEYKLYDAVNRTVAMIINAFVISGAYVSKFARCFLADLPRRCRSAWRFPVIKKIAKKKTQAISHGETATSMMSAPETALTTKRIPIRIISINGSRYNKSE